MRKFFARLLAWWKTVDQLVSEREKAQAEAEKAKEKYNEMRDFFVESYMAMYDVTRLGNFDVAYVNSRKSVDECRQYAKRYVAFQQLAQLMSKGVLPLNNQMVQKLRSER